MRVTHFISLAEAAYMAGTAEHEVSRLFRGQMLAPSLIGHEGAEQIVPLVAPLAGFCVATHGELTLLAQARVIRTLTERIGARQDVELFLGLHEQLGSTDFDWTVACADFGERDRSFRDRDRFGEMGVARC
ncbi:hypothetical protein [Ralstonia chuxiongensis]|uniref:hypothetical protein n=1 Tax=Ralstonia chuxiongensis TaxID=2957504 RepID=UPI0028F66DDE|nr:hypothetical protein [Ralstonia chuxiongensis]CAJ0785170.1 hypothetical protein R8510_05350 [Ralstonia chuxiongensis]